MDKNMIRRVITADAKETDKERILEFDGSDETQDRMDEVIRVEGWTLKNFKKNPVFLWAHNYNQPPIGKATRVWIDKEEKKLKFKIEFAPPETYEFADTIFKLYKGGFLKAVSVGFVPIESEEGEGAEDDYGTPSKKPRKIYLKQDLLEISAVPVPANPNALENARDEQLITTKEMDAVNDWIKRSDLDIKEDDSLEEKESIDKGVISYGSAHPNGTPKAEIDTPWDGPKEVKEAEVDDLKVMCAWVGEDPDIKGSYKLPHHTAKGHKLVWRAVAASGAAIMGGRGGVNIPDSDMKGVKAHIARHYSEFEKTPPWDKSASQVSQGEIADELDFLRGAVVECGIKDESNEAAWNLVREIMRLSGNDIPVDIIEKIGAVLNKKNREKLADIQRLAQEVLDSAEKPDKEEEDKSLSKEEWTPDDTKEAVKAAFRKITGKLD